MPKAFTDQEKELINERLLEAGHKLFAAYGLKKTTVDELASAAGISKGAFYLFYESKEALLMDVMEQAEEQFREEVMAVIEQPGPTPRARLHAVFQEAFTRWKTIPILQIFSLGDLDLLRRKIPDEKLQEHMFNDQQFIEELIARCKDAGILIKAPADQIIGLMYVLVFASIHEQDLGPGRLSDAMSLLLELVAAFCLGEVELQAQDFQNLVMSEDNESSN